MGKIKSIKWKLEPHTEAKHTLLRKYLEAWLPIITSQGGRVLFVDGFAGPGEYNGGEDGSPIIAIKTLLNHRLRIDTKVHFIFIEKDRDRCNFLEKKISTLKLKNNIKTIVICAEFADVIDGVLDDLEKKKQKLAPSFFFIDPFGFKAIPFGIIKRIMQNKKCEVLITFMYEEINRFLDVPEQEETYNATFGTEEWKKAREGKSPEERLKIIHGIYEKQLKKDADIEFGRSFKMKNKANRIDYFLFFGTNNLLGLKKMKAAMWRVDETGSFEFSDATYDPNQALLFELEPNYKLLKRIILEKFKGQGIRIEDLEYYVLTETPFRETHYKKQILKPMEKGGELEVYGSRKRRFSYPNGIEIEFK